LQPSKIELKNLVRAFLPAAFTKRPKMSGFIARDRKNLKTYAPDRKPKGRPPAADLFQITLILQR
jgi:hypothetical protein